MSWLGQIGAIRVSKENKPCVCRPESYGARAANGMGGNDGKEASLAFACCRLWRRRTKTEGAVMAYKEINTLMIGNGGPQFWEALDHLAEIYVENHASAYEERGTCCDDLAWRGVMRGIVTAVAAHFDSDVEAAIGSLSQALREIAPQMLRDAEAEADKG